MSCQPITKFVISSLDNKTSRAFIREVFSGCGVANLGKIGFHPLNSGYKMAFVDVKSWCDTEGAWRFVRLLKRDNGSATIYHSKRNYWVAKPYRKLVNSDPDYDLWREIEQAILEDRQYEDEIISEYEARHWAKKIQEVYGSKDEEQFLRKIFTVKVVKRSKEENEKEIDCFNCGLICTYCDIVKSPSDFVYCEDCFKIEAEEAYYMGEMFCSPCQRALAEISAARYGLSYGCSNNISDCVQITAYENE